MRLGDDVLKAVAAAYTNALRFGDIVGRLGGESPAFLPHRDKASAAGVAEKSARASPGNNNGYCQDNEISWVHWDNLPETCEALREFTRQIISLRQTQPLLRRENWRDGLVVKWFNAGGGEQKPEHWDEGTVLGLYIGRHDLQGQEGIWHNVLLLFNPFEGHVPFQIPQFGEGGWVLKLTTTDPAKRGLVFTRETDFELEGRSLALFRKP